MTTFDIVLVLVIAGAFVIGFLWGVIRSLLMLAAWLAVFLLSALLSVPAGDYLAGQWSAYDTHWNHMAAFAILYFAGIVLAAILIWVGIKGAQGLSKYRLLDDVVSGAIMAIVALLGIAGLIVILATAAIFSILHMPNWPVVALTFCAGLVWAWAFYHRPSILLVGLSHAVLGALTQVVLGLSTVYKFLVGPVERNAWCAFFFLVFQHNFSEESTSGLVLTVLQAPLIYLFVCVSIDRAARFLVGLGRQHLGEAHGVLHAHAAVAEGPHVLLEELARGRVVHVDVM